LLASLVAMLFITGKTIAAGVNKGETCQVAVPGEHSGSYYYPCEYVDALRDAWKRNGGVIEIDARVNR